MLTISGEYIESPRHPMLLKEFKDLKADGNGKMFCPKCTLGLDIKHTDVLILSQYIRSDGCMLPRRITGLCKVQQKRIGTLVTMAQKSGKREREQLFPSRMIFKTSFSCLGLMPNFAPANSKRDPKQRFAWKKYNKYYDESTIKMCNQKID